MKSPWTPGRQLRRWREKADLNATQAGAALGVSQQTISSWESNATSPHVRRSIEIEELYQLERGMVTALLSGDHPPDGANDPDAIGIESGRLVWDERTPVIDRDSQGRRKINATADVFGRDRRKLGVNTDVELDSGEDSWPSEEEAARARAVERSHDTAARGGNAKYDRLSPRQKRMVDDLIDEMLGESDDDG